MSNNEALGLLRHQLIKDITHMLCKPCTDPRRKAKVLIFDDPIACPCRCEIVNPLIARLTRVECEMGLR